MEKPPFEKTTIGSISLADIFKAKAAKAERDGIVPMHFNMPVEEWMLIDKIVKRTVDLATAHGFDAVASNSERLRMEISAVHCNTHPLNLWQLLAAGNDDFLHDVLGIGIHIDRENGHLRNGFKPRFAKTKQ